MAEEKTPYLPENQKHRQKLARDILDLLEYAKFTEQESIGEKVFSREVAPRVKVVVYTSIVGDEVREKDADAIRVCGVYTGPDGNERGLVRSSRIHRVGKLEEITDRLLKRMREVWKRTKNTERCSSCGAPKFTSQKGNLVCANLCFLDKK